MRIRTKDAGMEATELLFSCSGAADVAEIGDRAVRALHKAGEAKMFCLAGIAGRVELIESKTREAGRLVVLDGCESDCARKTMELGGYSAFTHVRVTDMGLEKGKSPATAESVERVAERLRELLGKAGQRAE